MIWIAVTALILGASAVTCVRVSQEAKTKRQKSWIKAAQIESYNSFLSDSDRHMVSNEVINACKITNLEEK